MSSSRQDITIVGGGAIGMGIAWELARRGQRVTLLERDRVGQATSRAGAGILPPANLASATDPIDQLRGLSQNLFPAWAEELQAITGIDCGLLPCGGWYLADTRGERAAMVGMTQYWDELEIECNPISIDQLVKREPSLGPWADRSDGAAAWWVPGESQIRPPRFVRALSGACRAAGVQVIEHLAASDIQPSGSRLRVIAGDRQFLSDRVVVCSGVWTGRIARSLHLEGSLVPVRGQMLLLKTDAPLLGSIVNLGNRYIVCRPDGHTLVGSCEEEVGYDLGTTDSMLESLRGFAHSVLPALESAEQLAAWSGLRPMTFDGFPMIGRVPGSDGVYVAAGHFRSGIHLSPGTALLMAELITDGPLPISLDPFRVGKQQSHEDDLPGAAAS